MVLQLYHTDMAVCAAKVRITLAEKGLQWESHHVDLSAGEQFTEHYRKLNPKAVVPTLLHNGHVVRESTVINEYLEDAFGGPSLRPDHPAERAQMRLWTKQEDEIHQVVNTFMVAIAFRPMELRKSPGELAQRASKITDLTKRARWLSLVQEGLASEHVAVAAKRLNALLSEMESTLAVRSWLAGDDFSLADIGFLPYLNAFAWLQFDEIWRARYEAVIEWLSRARRRPSVVIGLTNWALAKRVEMIGAAGAADLPQVRALLLKG